MGYEVTIERQPLRAIFDLAGALPKADVLPPPPGPNRASRTGERILIRTGPDRWLLMAPLAEEVDLARSLETAVLLSDAWTFFAVAGRDAGEVMAVATPLDVALAAFPEDAGCLTEAFGIRALVRRVPHGFEFGVDCSYADWFAEMLEQVAS